jgi:nucleoside-diphosphate-sugar epimerase
LIICSIGHGYLASFLFKELCALGVLGLGVSSKTTFLNKNSDNFKIFHRSEVKKAISYSTHLLVTAPSNKKGCPVFKNNFNLIAKSNIKSITYISTTGVYGNHKGEIVNEDALLKARYASDKYRILAEDQWSNFSKNNNNVLNIVRVAGIYGPGRVNGFIKNSKKKIVKKNHFFSRIHIFDIARVISKILLESNSTEIWNLSDNLSSTREDVLLEIVKLKKVKQYETISFKKYKVNLSKKARKFWYNNKRVSNKKVKQKLRYCFLFSNYKSGLKSLKYYL